MLIREIRPSSKIDKYIFIVIGNEVTQIGKLLIKLKKKNGLIIIFFFASFN